MLSGRKPFDGVGPKILMAHVREKPQPLASCCPEGSVPPPLDEVIQCMLEKLPSRRPQSTTELAEALHRLAANQGISMVELTPGRKIVWTSDHPAAAGVHHFQVLTTNGKPEPGQPMK